MDPFDLTRNRLIFTHIPKTAGTSLHQLLGEALDGKYTLLVGRNPALPEGDWLGAGGHQYYGGENPLHDHPGRLYVTLLRDPVDRVLSAYSHVSPLHDHPIFAQFPGALGKGPVDFVRITTRDRSSSLVEMSPRLLTGPGFDPTDPRGNIERVEAAYAVVGVLEELPAFVDALGQLFDRPMTMPALNARTRTAVTPAEREQLREITDVVSPCERALYNHFAGR